MQMDILNIATIAMALSGCAIIIMNAYRRADRLIQDLQEDLAENYQPIFKVETDELDITSIELDGKKSKITRTIDED